jgi:hypothetical protein
MGRTDEELRQKLQELEARDTQERSQVASYGVDLAKKRVIGLTFWAPDQTTANTLIEAMKRNELVPNLVLGPARADSLDQRWLVRAPFAGSVDFVTAQENVVTFIMFADKFGCDYDGWGTAIVEVALKN